MSKTRLRYESLAGSNPGKINSQANSVNSVARKVSLSFKKNDDLLMNKNALNKDSLAYTSEIQNRLG